ncbi:MAG: YfhO family protein, partial [Acutalibacteraceae bacterium]
MTIAKRIEKVPKDKLSFAERVKGFFSHNVFILLAFAVPFVLMVTAFGIMQVSPFGDKQILVTDLWHQYFPFLVDFQDKLKNGESMFWSWAQGGGVNYFSLMSYYVASPLNFLSVFIPSEWLREFLM